MPKLTSRLDHFIARMVSQRACLDFVAQAATDMPGPVLELGLGNGRTYHHLCQIMPGRDIWVFDRAVASHPASTPPQDHLILGEVSETLPQALERFGPTAVLVHADLGGHDPARNDEFARHISPLIEPLVAPGGYMVSSDRMYFAELEEQPLPEGAIVDRCFLYRRAP